MSSNKIINIEVLRVLAVIAVILIHMSMGHFYDKGLMNNDYPAWIMNNVYYTATRFCVPVFFIIAAYIAFNNKSYSTWTDKIIRIGLPYLAWSIIYFWYNSSGPIDVLELVKKTFTSNTSFHLWFIPPFLGFVILLPAIRKIFGTDEDKKQFRHVFVILFIFSIILPSLITGINYVDDGYKFLYGLNNYGLTISGLLLYAFAFPFMNHKMRPVVGLAIYVLLIALNLVINITVSDKLSKPNESFYGYNSALVFISSFVFFNIIMSIDFSRLRPFASKTIYAIGHCTFGIYLVHWLVFMVLKNNGLVLNGMAILDPIINTAIVFLISFAVVFTARKFKPLRYLC